MHLKIGFIVKDSNAYFPFITINKMDHLAELS